MSVVESSLGVSRWTGCSDSDRNGCLVVICCGQGHTVKCNCTCNQSGELHLKLLVIVTSSKICLPIAKEAFEHRKKTMGKKVEKKKVQLRSDVNTTAASAKKEIGGRKKKSPKKLFIDSEGIF